MLNGVDPILIFSFRKKIIDGTAKVIGIPIADDLVQSFALPNVPIYLSEQLTGISIDTEDKSIEIQTDTESTADGKEPLTEQRPIQSTVKISMVAERSSIGISLFAALADLVFPKLASREYSVTYLHGAIVVFNGLLHSFSISQNASDTRYTINLELTRGSTKQPTEAKTMLPQAQKFTGAVPL